MSFRESPDRDAPNLLPTVAQLTVTVLILAAFLLYQSIAERNALLATISTQEPLLKQVQQFKTQLDGLASGTAKLADQGNPGAKEVIESFKKQGITIHK